MMKYCSYSLPLLNLHPHAPPNLSISTAVLEIPLLGRVPRDLIQPLKFSMYSPPMYDARKVMKLLTLAM